MADIEINKMMMYSRENKTWMCTTCNYFHARKEVVHKHVDSKHCDFLYCCVYCDKVSPTQHALSQHVSCYHKNH